MKHEHVAPRKRRSVNLSIDADVVAAARATGINMSQVSEAAIKKAARAAADARWREEHHDWIEANNAWVEANGLPLEKYRMF